MNCLRCGEVLAGRQKNYCSARCSKLYLKAQWRRRNRERVREYNRQYRAMAVDGYAIGSLKQRSMLLALMPECQRCGTKENLQRCHIKPHWAKGTNELHNFYVFCGKCHHDFDWALRGFWGGEPLPYEDFDAAA